MERAKKGLFFGCGKRLRLWVFVAIFSAVYWLLVDVAEFCDQPVDGAADTLYMLAYFAVIALMQAAIIGLISLNRYIFAVAAPLLLIAGTILTYFFITLHTTMSPTIAGLVLTNDVATSVDLVTGALIAALIGTIIVAGVFIYVRFRCVREPSPRDALIAATVMILLLFGLLSIGKIKTIAEQREPFIIYASFRDYFSFRENAAEERHTFDREPCIADNDTITVVLVIGESLRSDHLGINGYERNTTPLLSKTPGLVSYPNLRVSTFHTAISLPRLMTRADDNNQAPELEEQSFITLFKNAGFSTYWIANQEPLDSFVYFVEESDSVINTHLGHSLYNYDSWLDGDMLPAYGELLRGEAPRKLIVLHTIGNHWWYNTHYDRRHARYKPELTSRNINANSLDRMINSYDNCVLYTDWFLSRVIAPLRDSNAVMVMISDHGEGLGEDGMLLHAGPSEGTRKAALLFWMSESYRAKNPEVARNILANKDRAVSNDLLFHTMVDCGRIRTAAVDTTKSVARSL